MPNKENTIANTMRTLERKKGSSSQSNIKKVGRASSSATNITKKLQIKNSLI